MTPKRQIRVDGKAENISSQLLSFEHFLFTFVFSVTGNVFGVWAFCISHSSSPETFEAPQFPTSTNSIDCISLPAALTHIFSALPQIHSHSERVVSQTHKKNPVVIDVSLLKKNFNGDKYFTSILFTFPLHDPYFD